MSIRNSTSIILAMVGSLFLPARAEAFRIIGITISLEGKPYLSGTIRDNGLRKEHHLSRDLKEAALKPADGVRIEPDEAGGHVATLKGRIGIKVSYNTTADVTELHLVRSKGEDSAWSVDAGDVERIANLIGLPEVTDEDRELASPFEVHLLTGRRGR